METKKDKKDVNAETRVKSIESYYSVLSALKVEKNMGKLVKTHLIKKTKKELARILTANNR